MTDELRQLCEAAVEDRLTDDQVRHLEQLVLGDPAALRFYVEYVHQHGSLRWSAADPAYMERGTRKTERPVLRLTRRRWTYFAAGLAAAVLLGVGLWLTLPSSAAPVATLASGKTCKWDGGTLPTEVGARLAAGRLRLAEGIARIAFDNGALVTIEGPADLELVTGQRCVLHSGRLVAKVPPAAIGFIVDTPTAVFKDLGTEFGVHVRDAQTAELQVFNGIVDSKHKNTGQTERLETGRNRRYLPGEVVDFDPQAEKPTAVGQPRPVEDDSRTVQISTATGRGRDAFIQPLFPSINHSEILLLVKSTKDEKSDYNRKAYVGLDLESIARLRVVDAQLTFSFAPTGMGFASEVPDATFAVYGLTDDTDGWDEKTIRWRNAPANLPGGSALDADKTTLLGKFEIAQGALEGTRSVSGPLLVDFLNSKANGLATFILVRETRGSGRSDLVHGFACKEHPTLPPPTLKLAVVPKGQ